MSKVNKIKRPTSPFLTVYEPQITSMFSIAERITGLLLVLVVFLVVILLKLDAILLTNYWYYSLCYSVIKGSVSGVFIGGLLFFVILCGVYHTVFGVRYLYWDRAYSKLTMDEINKTTPILVGITIGLTLLYWLW